MIKSNQIELIGVPGSGKSSLLQYLVKTGNFISCHNAKKSSAGKWFSKEVVTTPIVNRLFSGIILKYYLSRPKSIIRSLISQQPELLKSITGWLESGTDGDVIEAARYLESLSSVFEVLGTTYLIENYFENRTPIIFDEYWTQLMLAKLKWGDHQRYELWLQKVIPWIPFPERVVWLKNAASVAEYRQTGRNKVALLFTNCSSIKDKCIEIEQSIQDGVEILKDVGIKVLELDSEATLKEKADQLIQWAKL